MSGVAAGMFSVSSSSTTCAKPSAPRATSCSCDHPALTPDAITPAPGLGDMGLAGAAVGGRVGTIGLVAMGGAAGRCGGGPGARDRGGAAGTGPAARAAGAAGWGRLAGGGEG